MAYTATLIGTPGRASIDDRLADAAASAVGTAARSWLCEGDALDIPLPPETMPGEVHAALRSAIDGAPVDIAVLPTTRRRKKILIADMDSTMIDQECIDELADEVGLKDRVADITARSMNGEIAFEPALRERVGLLKGLDASVIAGIIDKRIRLASGARELVKTMRANGAWTALVSGGFTAFTGPIAEALGFDENRANTLLIKRGKLTGQVQEPILGREAKAKALHEIAARLGVDTSDAMAVGDGANDLDMIRLAGVGVALHAKPAVAAQASIRIDHGDLTALLYLQGYKRSDFAI